MLLQMINVSKNFGGVDALSNISFAVNHGDILGIIGPNGAGKTTLFNLITGVFPVSTGKIIFDDQLLGILQPHKITELGVARTFQNIRLFDSMTVLENILVGEHCRMNTGVWAGIFKTDKQHREERKALQRAHSLLTFVGLRDDADQLAGTLPYGKQRRLEIARAMASSPQLLLLDEPAAGMNDSETEALRQLIGCIRNEYNMSIVIIEHDMNLMMNICNRLVVLNFGSKIADGTPEEIQHNLTVIEAYLGKESA